MANRHLFGASEGERQGHRSGVPVSLQGVERDCTVSAHVHLAFLESTADLLADCTGELCTERVNSMAKTECSTQQVLLKAKRTVAANEEVKGHRMPTKGKYLTL